MDIDAIMRTIHIIAGTIWFGQVVVINFVLIPSLGKFKSEERKAFILTIFPKIFRVASHLSIIAVLTGIHLVVSLTDADLSNLLSGRWGLSILIGGSLGILLTLFHFFMENRMAKKIGIAKDGNDDMVDDVHLKLKIVPRLGLVVITLILLLMINASRGIF